MSSREPIVINILSDDDESVNDVKNFSSEENEKILKLFLSITAIPEDRKNDAITSLELNNYDLDEAIAFYFDHETESIQGVAHEDTKYCNFPIKSSSSDDNCNEFFDMHKPSKKWNDIVECCKSLKCHFVDDSFPPQSSSLDGRKEVDLKKSTTKKSVICCRCNLPAVIKTVSKEGPNYGRFYLSCGKPKQRKKRKRDASSEERKIVNNYDIQCQFFQWDDNHEQTSTATKNGWANTLTWFRYEKRHGYCLTSPRGHYSPSHVQQGSVGNCWFLSALAVVAERPYLIRSLIPHVDLNDIGCYEVNFFIDGRWTSVIVDSYLPSVIRSSSDKKKIIVGSVSTSEGVTVHPAFASGTVCWPAIVEKAYAKIHGSYARLSGGFISEALFDLTGAPTERIHFRRIIDNNELFARLLSFTSSGFIMGIATTSGGDGLVPCHAYSVLGVWEVNNATVGRQPKMTKFLAPKLDNNDEDVILLDGTQTIRDIQVNDEVILVERLNSSEETAIVLPTTVRLVKIRNPWGAKEWKGSWSANSEEWTDKIRKKLGNDICKQGDGTFFMSFDDMLKRFDHMDVCKCQEGWLSSSRGSLLKLSSTEDPLISCVNVFKCKVDIQSWTFISLVQQKKRSNATSQFWYSDLSMIILHRKNDCEWILLRTILQGVSRTCDCELFLSPEYEYCFIPFSFLSGKDELQCGAVSRRRAHASFMFTSYSPRPLNIRAQNRLSFGEMQPLLMLHDGLIKSRKKISYNLGNGAMLLAVNGDKDCVYFVACNGGLFGIMLRLDIHLESSNGLKIVCGQNKETLAISPGTKLIPLVVASDGINLNPNISFEFISEIIPSKHNLEGKNSNVGVAKYQGLRTVLPLCPMSKSMCMNDTKKSLSKTGKGIIDERIWSTL